MSHRYTTAELEAMRREQIRRELADNINKLKEQLKQKHENAAQITAGLGIERKEFLTDVSVSGYKKSMSAAEMLIEKSTDRSVKDDELVFSVLLSSSGKANKLKTELDALIKRADERPIITEDDAQQQSKLLTWMSAIVGNDSIDIEDKIMQIKNRVTAFLECAARLTEEEKIRIENEYYEYCAACEMIGEEATEHLPYKVESELQRIKALLEKRKQDEYIADVIENIMTDLGCQIEDNAILRRADGHIYSVKEHPFCDIFIGTDGEKIMLEPIGNISENDLETKKQQAESSANSICSIFDKLEERAKEKGVIIKRIISKSVQTKDMFVKSDVGIENSGKKRKKATVQKQRALKAEG